MHPEVERQIEELNAKVEAAMKPYLGKATVSEHTLHEIKRSMIALIEPYRDQDLEHFKFVPDPNDRSALIPANLYTAMRLYLGLDAPTYAECEGGVYRHQDLVFRWDPETMQTTCVVPRPLNQIKVTLSVTRDKVEQKENEDT